LSTQDNNINEIINAIEPANRQLMYACTRGDQQLAINALNQSTVDIECLHKLPPTSKLQVPRATIDQGITAVRQWITDATCINKRIKLLVLGHARAGKTSILATMQQHLATTSTQQQQPPQLQTTLHHTESTIGIDIIPSDGIQFDNDIQYRVFDFAGQLEYLSTHQVSCNHCNPRPHCCTMAVHVLIGWLVGWLMCTTAFHQLDNIVKLAVCNSCGCVSVGIRTTTPIALLA
jgi:hypothetical protein